MYRFSSLEASVRCAAYRYKSCGNCTDRCRARSVPPLCCADRVHCCPVYCSEGRAGCFLPYFLRLFLYKLVETLKPWITHYYSVQLAVSACRTLLPPVRCHVAACLQGRLYWLLSVYVYGLFPFTGYTFMVHHNSTAPPLKIGKMAVPVRRWAGKGTYIYTGQDLPDRVQKAAQPAGLLLQRDTGIFSSFLRFRQ